MESWTGLRNYWPWQILPPVVNIGRKLRKEEPVREFTGRDTTHVQGGELVRSGSSQQERLTPENTGDHFLSPSLHPGQIITVDIMSKDKNNKKEINLSQNAMDEL